MKKIITILISFFLLSCQGQKKEEEKIIKKETSTAEVSSKSDNTKNLLQLAKINCNEESTETGNYYLHCKNFSVSNTLIEGSDQNKYELITFVFDDIEKAIIRKINNEDLETSSPIIYFSNTSKNYIIFFPINGENHFGWKLYLYKNKVLYPLGQRVMYWNSDYEETNTSYSEILNVFETKDSVIVEIPSKYIIKDDNDYKNYPNYLDGKYYEDQGKSYYEFSTSKIEYYKKYKNGLFEGDYNKMINNKIIDLIK
ncbi:hypothetical protein EG339_13315 [Chryseobacterium bernardetii]|uniref:Lipoprotein n=1 Tax=Chryseobacterium bernardetii TaxID=1241978 RepID=A0A3G6THE8_9FLAO|nr:hypothetical protein [Chryseobacterium bernardetii]AZB25490.1 hypothetical protein EG339_13315 [Chryseobacterium bernardetii]